MNRLLSLRVSAGPLLVGGLLLVSCSSGEEREYALPEKLCGVPFGKDGLDVLLPPGKELKVDATKFSERSYDCQVTVDGRWVATIGTALDSEGVDPVEAGRAGPYNFSEPRSTTLLGAPAALSAEGAMVNRVCFEDESREHRYLIVYAEVREHAAGEGKERLDAIQAVTEDYLRAQKKHFQCDA